jgi:hypothetical protein
MIRRRLTIFEIIIARLVHVLYSGLSDVRGDDTAAFEEILLLCNSLTKNAASNLESKRRRLIGRFIS